MSLRPGREGPDWPPPGYGQYRATELEPEQGRDRPPALACCDEGILGRWDPAVPVGSGAALLDGSAGNLRDRA
jgi:hypothetical protein